MNGFDISPLKNYVFRKTLMGHSLKNTL